MAGYGTALLMMGFVSGVLVAVQLTTCSCLLSKFDDLSCGDSERIETLKAVLFPLDVALAVLAFILMVMGLNLLCRG